MPVPTSNSSTVLVVDDESDIRNLLKDLLELYGYSVVTASSADSAYSILQERDVSAVVSDVIMKGETGVDLLVRTRQASSDVPFVMISGFAGDHTEDSVVAAGADAFIKKPFSQIDLIAAIKKAIEEKSN